jgi:hypothetical protein
MMAILLVEMVAAKKGMLRVVSHAMQIHEAPDGQMYAMDARMKMVGLMHKALAVLIMQCSVLAMQPHCPQTQCFQVHVSLILQYTISTSSCMI